MGRRAATHLSLGPRLIAHHCQSQHDVSASTGGTPSYLLHCTVEQALDVSTIKVDGTHLALISIGVYPAWRARMWAKVVFPTPGGPLRSNICRHARTRIIAFPWRFGGEGVGADARGAREAKALDQAMHDLSLRHTPMVIVGLSVGLCSFTKNGLVPRLEPLQHGAIAALPPSGMPLSPR